MFVLEILPLTPDAPAGTLSYRSGKKVAPGSLVTVTLRRKQVPGVVVEATPAREAKAMLKSASFMLSGNVSKPIGMVPPPFMEAVERIAAWHAASRGAVCAALLQENLAEPLCFPAPAKARYELQPIEEPLRERAATYRKLIRENAEKKHATLFVVSTLAEVEYWKRELADLRPLIFSGAVTASRRAEIFKKAAGMQFSGVIISTPSFAFVPIANLSRIIVERVGAGGFRLLKRPYLDMRVALMEFARAYELPITYGDFPLPLEYRADSRGLSETPGCLSILDTRRDAAKPASGARVGAAGAATVAEEAPWSAVPQELRERIRQALDAGGRVAVLAVRKGYAPVVVCRDCGQALRDERGMTYAFTQDGSANDGRNGNGKRFRTSDGVSVLSTDIRCPNCDSWNLLPLGVGVERVVEELKQAFPNAPLVHFDADTVRTPTAAKKRLAPLAAPGAIVVGTEAMVPWLLAAAPEPLSFAAVASADSLLALPFWRARERFVRLAYLLTAVAPEVMICTRMPDDAALKLIRNSHDRAFFDEERALRKALGYPPFGTLISLQCVGTQRALDQLEQKIRNVLSSIKDISLRSVPDRLVRGAQYRRTFVLALPAESWPNEMLSDQLASLPSSVRITIDPESFS